MGSVKTLGWLIKKIKERGMDVAIQEQEVSDLQEVVKQALRMGVKKGETEKAEWEVKSEGLQRATLEDMHEKTTLLKKLVSEMKVQHETGEEKDKEALRTLVKMEDALEGRQRFIEEKYPPSGHQVIKSLEHLREAADRGATPEEIHRSMPFSNVPGIVGEAINSPRFSWSGESWEYYELPDKIPRQQALKACSDIEILEKILRKKGEYYSKLPQDYSPTLKTIRDYRKRLDNTKKIIERKYLGKEFGRRMRKDKRKA